MEKILSLLDRVLERIRIKEDNHTYTQIVEVLVLTPANSLIEFVKKLEDKHVISSIVEILLETLTILTVIIIIFHQLK